MFYETTFFCGKVGGIAKNNYDLWSDPAYDDYDYDTEIKREYQELGYNPREVKPVGKELANEKD